MSRTGRPITFRLAPGLLLLLTVLLLTVILATMGQRTLQRERSLLLDLKGRQAQLIARSVASAARIGAMMPQAGLRQLERFVNDAADSDDVEFIAVYDHSGRLLAASPGFSPSVHGLGLGDMEHRLGREDHAVLLEEGEAEGAAGRFLMLNRFYPLDSSWVHLRLLEVPPIPGLTEGDERPHAERGPPSYALVAMTTSDLDDTVRQGVRQALLNGFLLLLLGTAGFYFLFFAQGYLSVRRALDEARQYAMDVIQGMAEGLVNLRGDGILLSVNAEAEKVLGQAERALVGRHWSEVFVGEPWSSVRRFLTSGTPFYDLEVPSEGEGRPTLEATMIPVRSPEGSGGMVLFLRDMGEVAGLRAEVRRAERLAALGRLVAGMAHEIRNPLNAIRGFSQHLRGKLDPSGSEGRAVEVIIREVDRLNRVITDLLDFSRPKEPRMEAIDLNAVVTSTMALVEREASSLGVQCVRDTASAEVSIRGDADSLKQLLLNLLLNALQAMPEGGVLTVSTRREGGRGVLSVADTGTGISPEDQERVFEPFFTRREGGTGLGLAIVHRIAQDHGAELRLSSVPGQGTTFTLRFPDQRAAEGGAAP